MLGFNINCYRNKTHCKKKHRGVTFLISADSDHDVVMSLNQSVQFNGLL